MRKRLRPPADELLKLPFLQLDQVKDSLHAYQLSKRGNSLRVMAEAVHWGKRRANQCDQPGDHHDRAREGRTQRTAREGYRRMIEGSVAKRAARRTKSVWTPEPGSPTVTL